VFTDISGNGEVKCLLIDENAYDGHVQNCLNNFSMKICIIETYIVSEHWVEVIYISHFPFAMSIAVSSDINLPRRSPNTICVI
jgi:hypothetical protein